MKADAMLIIEGTIAALLLYWVVKNASAVNSLTTAGTGATVKGFQALIGR